MHLGQCIALIAPYDCKTCYKKNQKKQISTFEEELAMIQSLLDTWWQDDLPCEFDKIRTKINRDYLINVLGENWIINRIQKDIHHPIITRWNTAGANAYLELNSLAEDIRLIAEKPNFDSILKDLKDTRTCLATWHTIHCASLFERGESGSIVGFFRQTSSSIPDFSVKTGGVDYPVECKLLTDSDCQAEFGKYTDDLMKNIQTLIFADEKIYPLVYIIIKCFERLPTINNVVNSLKEGLEVYKGDKIKGAFEKFNVFIELNTASKEDFSLHKSVHIYCPRSEKENIRVEGRIKNAASQIRLFNSIDSGIVCVGINRHQDAEYIVEKITNRFLNNQLKSISCVFLIRTGTFLEPPKRTVVDLISTFKNSNSKNIVPTDNLKIGTIGASGKLLDYQNKTSGIPAYRHIVMEYKLINLNAVISSHELNHLTKEMLE